MLTSRIAGRCSVPALLPVYLVKIRSTSRTPPVDASRSDGEVASGSEHRRPPGNAQEFTMSVDYPMSDTTITDQECRGQLVLFDELGSSAFASHLDRPVWVPIGPRSTRGRA
jgi:hypothetical protein